VSLRNFITDDGCAVTVCWLGIELARAAICTIAVGKFDRA
jgi:hypothetical protein